MKTLSDPLVRNFLRDRFVLVFHNQLPALYCNNTVDPGVDRYPQDQIDGCREGAGGGNVRCYVCSPDGAVLFLTMGYWRRERFIQEMEVGLELDRNPSARDRSIREHIESHKRRGADEPTARAVENLMIRAHEEARADLLKPIADVLRRVEDEIYLKGKIG